MMHAEVRPSVGFAAEAIVVPKRIGLVVLVDALGTTKERSEREWIQLTNTRVRSFRQARGIAPIHEVVGTNAQGKPPPGPVLTIRHDVVAFSDSLLLTFEADDASADPARILRDTSSTLVQYFTECLGRGDLLRGAAAFGTYYEGDRIFTGPAILDAAFYYDVADWAGLILTPQTADLWKKGKDGFASSVNGRAFSWVETKVPISQSVGRRKRRELRREGCRRYALSWWWAPPPQLNRNARRTEIESAFKPGPGGSGWETKRKNTLRFFDERWEATHPPADARAMARSPG
jgi:hypothetical protein